MSFLERVRLTACLLVLVSSGCAASRPVQLRLEPVPETTQILIRTDAPVGLLRLWLPEGVASNEGFSSVYPTGVWEGDTVCLHQKVGCAQAFGPGNFAIRENSVECAGIEVPREPCVEWRADAQVRGNRVHFGIQLRNAGSEAIRRASAPICLKFADAPWWRQERVFVRSGGREMTLGKLGEHAGKVPGFEAFLLRDQNVDNRFYHEFWGISPHRLDVPIMISHHPAGWRVGITARRAVFLHSNRLNPCTDVMLAFGDLAPGQEAESQGEVWIDPP